MPRVGRRRIGFRHAGFPGLGCACARRHPGSARGVRRCAHGAAVGVARVPDPEVAVRNRPGYEWMALAHRALGEDEVAAADAATAQSIYEHLSVEPAGICESASPGRPDQTGVRDPHGDRPWRDESDKWPSRPSSARSRSHGTWPTSTPSSGFRRAPPRWPGRASTTCCNRVGYVIAPSRAGRIA